MHDAAVKPDLRAKRMYESVLAGWARDALILRRAGLDRPSVRNGRGVGLAPPPELRRTRERS